MYRLLPLLLLVTSALFCAPYDARAGAPTLLAGVARMTDDCDSDGLSDEVEETMGLEPCRADTDGDSLTDYQEVKTYGTNPKLADTDGDSLTDYQEAKIYGTNPKLADTDGDGLGDGREVRTTHSDPLLADTDGDGLPDGEEAERVGSNPKLADTDGDGFSDGDEVRSWHTDPRLADTDGDGLSDALEALHLHTDPLDADTDDDGTPDGTEVLTMKSDPRRADTDGDSIPDGRDRCPLLAGTAERSGCPLPPRAGATAAFPDLAFADDRDTFDTTDAITAAALNRMLAFMAQCREMSVIVEGYAAGPLEKRNLEVSEARARRLAAWLAEHRVDANRVELAIGYGSRKGDAASGVLRPRSIILRVARACE